MLKESGKPIMLKIYDVSPSLSGSSTTTLESESIHGTDTVEILKSDSSGRDVMIGEIYEYTCHSCKPKPQNRNFQIN